MILDPRLVPWADIAPGVTLSILLAACGWVVIRKWSWPAMAMFTLAPVLGWARMIYDLSGQLPAIPPADAPLWALYFALAGAVFGLAAPLWARCRWSRTAGAVALGIAVAAAVWYLLVQALHESVAVDLASGGIFTLILSIAAVAFAAIGWPADHASNYAGKFSPWITGLFTAAVCLTLSGTARIGTLALGLALANIPPALGLLFAPGPRATRQPDHTSPQALVLPWLPAAFALPPVILSGPLFANTPWLVASLVLAGVLFGTAVVSIWEILSRRNSALNHIGPKTNSLIAIILGIAATAAPVIWAIRRLLAEAAAAGFPY